MATAIESVVSKRGDTEIAEPRNMSRADRVTPETASESPTEILTPQQLADRLQVKPSWVYEQTRSRSGVRNADPLPHIKMGLYLRFDWRDVLGWLERQKQRRERAKNS